MLHGVGPGGDWYPLPVYFNHTAPAARYAAD